MKVVLMGLMLSLTMHSALAQGQSEQFKLGPPSGYGRFFPVVAVNGDPTADTPEKVAQIDLTLAKAGDAQAAWQIGLAYMQGQGIRADLEQAQHWLAIGAIRPQEKAVLGELYEDGDYLHQDAAKAAYWLTAAGRPGDLFELAEMYRKAQPSQVGRAAPIYRSLLSQDGHPEVRRAKLELGTFVLDGTYSAGDDSAGQALNLEWAKSIAQELLGQSDYNIAVDYSVGREGVPKSEAMWARYCARAAAYNIDLAQEFFAKAILKSEISGTTPLEGYAWMRLASDKRYADRPIVQALEAQMTPQTRLSADSYFEDLVKTREEDGAFYRTQDPLRTPTEATLAAVPPDDPDVEVRRAYALELSHTPASYKQALALYLAVRNTSHMAAMAALGRQYMLGTDGMATDPANAHLWLERSVGEGYHPAALLLARWYRGEGGGTSDSVQALAWEMIGDAKRADVNVTSDLNKEQKQAARKQYEGWLAAHPGWSPQPR